MKNFEISQQHLLGKLVISGTNTGIKLACKKLLDEGAKRALQLPVGGAFHSPLMRSAQDELEKAINNTPNIIHNPYKNNQKTPLNAQHRPLNNPPHSQSQHKPTKTHQPHTQRP